MDASNGPFKTIREAKAKAKVGHTKLYVLLNTGKLRAVKAGRRTLVDDASIDAYLAALPSYQPKAA